MIINDRGTDFRTTYDIDSVAHPDSEIVKIYGKEYALGVVRNVFGDHEEKNNGMIVFYDDVFQYTSIGLLDIIFELKGIQSPLPINEFMERKCSGLKFVENICSIWGITRQEIDYINKTYYAEILERSPLSSNSKSFMMMRQFLDSQLLVFRYNCNGLNKIFEKLREEYKNAITDKYVSLELDFRGTKSEYEYLNGLNETRYHLMEIVATENAGDVSKFIEDKHVDVGSNIFTFRNHNGLSIEQLCTVVARDGFGNGDYKVHFIKEEMALC